MKKVILIVFMVLILAGWLFLRNKGDVMVNTPTASPTPVATNSPSPSAVPISGNVITYTDSGYTPNTITIKKGEMVTWKNESKFLMWTASAVHPTHRAYPGTDITACGTQTLLPMFDACAGITFGQSWSFKFDNVGTWGYHNHSNSSHWGKVIVE